MPIRFQCTQCGKLLQIPEDAAGRPVQCPECQFIATAPVDVSAGGQTEPEAVKPPVDFNDATEPSRLFEDRSNPYQAPYAPSSGLERDLGQLERASRGMRFVGWLVDGFVHLLGAMPGIVVVILGFIIAENGDEEPGFVIVMIGAAIAVLGALVIAVVNWILITRDGQTIAKKWFGMRIVDANDGTLPGFVRGVILRIWVPVLINQLCGLFPLIDALFIFGDQRQCIHDLFANTIVIDVQSEPTKSEWLRP